MTEIEKTFRKLKQEKRKALVPFITFGYPDIPTTKKLLYALEENGADIIELGIPYSDPLADGPVICQTYEHALKKEINLRAAFENIARWKKELHVPLILMTYYNPLYQYGLEKFARGAKNAGVSGVIISDLPFEESRAFQKICARGALDLISLLAPTSTKARIHKLAAHATGFIYCVSRTGTTGVREKLYGGLGQFIKNVRAQTPLPLCIGFGISTPPQAQEAAELSDGVIVGSALIRVMQKNLRNGKLLSESSCFIRSLRRATDASQRE